MDLYSRILGLQNTSAATPRKINMLRPLEHYIYTYIYLYMKERNLMSYLISDNGEKWYKEKEG